VNRSKFRQATGCAGFALAAVLSFASLLHGEVQSSVQAQIVFPPIVTIVFPTPTRTPTPINVGNFVWSDLDGDGRQDAGEPGIAGVLVQLWNSDKTIMFDQTVTNANGNYTLVAPTPGNYRVAALLPAPGDQFSPKNVLVEGDTPDLKDSDINAGGTNFGFTDIYVFGSNLISITSIDIGIRRFFTPTPTRTPTPINIGNFIWDDANNNGNQDAGELGVANVTVQLWDANTNQLIDTAVTNANGNYTVVAPTPGDYRVRVLLGIGSSFAPKDAVVDDLKDSDCNTAGINLGYTDVFNIANNVISTTKYDCGLRGPYYAATPTPLATSTPTPTSTSTPTSTPTVDAEETVMALPDYMVYIPIAVR
jgi:hypothetical protein